MVDFLTVARARAEDSPAQTRGSTPGGTSILPPSSSIGALGPSMALGSCGGGRSRARGTGRRATWNRRGFPRCATRGGGGAGAADERVELVKGLGDLLDLEPDLREIGVAARDPKGRKFSESAFVGGSTRNVLQIVVGDHNLPLSSRRTRRRTNRTSCSPRLSGASARTADDPPTQMVTERVPIGPGRTSGYPVEREELSSNHNPRTRREG